MNKTFGELFNYLTSERNLIPLGLYRLPGASDNKNAYVFTNPRPNVKLTHKDRVFVLSYNMPKDLRIITPFLLFNLTIIVQGIIFENDQEEEM